MIIKVLSRTSGSVGTASSGLLSYILKYILNDNKIKQTDIAVKGFRDGAFLIKHNIRSRSTKGFVREFNENESYRLVHRKDSVKIFHSIISFSPEDRHLITDAILKDVAKKYIQERGPNCLWVGSKHEDKDHAHLHLCQSGTQLNGRSARVSKQQFKSITLSLDKYQKEKYSFLTNSLPDFAKEKRQSKEAIIEKLKANRQITKATLFESIEKIYANTTSKKEFINQLKIAGHNIYERNGTPQGIFLDGKTKFRFSRLGFDQAKFETKDRINEHIELNKLSSLRQIGARSEIKKENEETRSINCANEDKAALEELSAIRKRSRIKEKEYARELVNKSAMANEAESGGDALVESDWHQPRLPMFEDG